MSSSPLVRVIRMGRGEASRAMVVSLVSSFLRISRSISASDAVKSRPFLLPLRIVTPFSVI